MIAQLMLFILDAVFGFFTILLLARFYMQLARVSFRNQVGGFVIQLTDWMVVPARRVLPAMGGWDVPTLACAWLVQVVLAFLSLVLRGYGFGDPLTATLAMIITGFLELIRLSIYFLMLVVIVDAVMSFVAPYHPLREPLGGISRPFLAPIRRVLPTFSGVDLSPLVLILILQMVLIVLGNVGAGMFRLLG
jgi:YggT family protein